MAQINLYLVTWVKTGTVIRLRCPALMWILLFTSPSLIPSTRPSPSQRLVFHHSCTTLSFILAVLVFLVTPSLSSSTHPSTSSVIHFHHLVSRRYIAAVRSHFLLPVSKLSTIKNHFPLHHCLHIFLALTNHSTMYCTVAHPARPHL